MQNPISEQLGVTKFPILVLTPLKVGMQVWDHATFDGQGILLHNAEIGNILVFYNTITKYYFNLKKISEVKIYVKILRSKYLQCIDLILDFVKKKKNQKLYLTAVVLFENENNICYYQT